MSKAVPDIIVCIYLYSCSGKRKRSHEPKAPPPSREQINGEVPYRHSLATIDDVNITLSSDTPTPAAPPPPLPLRNIGNIDKNANANIYHDSDKMPINHDILADKQPKTRTSILSGPVRQLSTEILQTRVPPSPTTKSGSPTKFSSRPPLERLESEAYLDPESTPACRAPTAPSQGTPRLKASLSEEKKEKILGDYFQGKLQEDRDYALNIKVPLPSTDSREKTMPYYSNVTSDAGYPETFSPETSNDKFRFGVAQTSPTDSPLKSPLRKPRPMPRPCLSSNNSSRKQSLTPSDPGK